MAIGHERGDDGGEVARTTADVEHAIAVSSRKRLEEPRVGGTVMGRVRRVQRTVPTREPRLNVGLNI